MWIGAVSMAAGRQGRVSATFIKVAVVAALVQCAMAVTHTVGGDKGWDFIDYNAWVAKEKTFKVGDTLLFKYSAELHSVYQVGEESYKSCTLSAPLKTYASGADTVELTEATTYYFICGVPGHCVSGMAVAIPVTGGSTPSAPAPAPTVAPAPPPKELPSPAPAKAPPTASPSPSETTPSPSTPPSSLPPQAAYTPSQGPSTPKNAAAALQSGAMIVPSAILSGILLFFF